MRSPRGDYFLSVFDESSSNFIASVSCSNFIISIASPRRSLSNCNHLTILASTGAALTAASMKSKSALLMLIRAKQSGFSSEARPLRNLHFLIFVSKSMTQSPLSLLIVIPDKKWPHHGKGVAFFSSSNSSSSSALVHVARMLSRMLIMAHLNAATRAT